MTELRSLSSIEDTKEFAREFAQRISLNLKNQPLTIGLVGELGAGKTTFVRYLVSALGGGDSASSPTYVLQHIYNASNLTIEHWDLYRVKSVPEELNEPPGRGVIRLIEWVDRDQALLDSCDIVISIALSEKSREFKIFQH